MQHHDGIMQFFSVGLAGGGIAFMRSESFVEQSLDSFRGRPWVWLLGQERAAWTMRKIVGPSVVVAGASVATISAYRLIA